MNELDRRTLLKVAGASAGAYALSAACASPSPRDTAALTETGADMKESVTVKENRISVETSALKAVFDAGVLISLLRKSDGRELITNPDRNAPPLSLIYASAETVPLSGRPRDSVTCRLINPHLAEIRFNGWNGDGVILVGTDAQTADLLVEPAAYSSRSGLRACRWAFSGFDRDLELVAPFFQGIRLPLDDPLIANTHWHWPHFWEAGLAILQGKTGGLYLHCRDTRYRYKALQVGSPSTPRSLGLETESYGPLRDNLSAGGLQWRIGVHDGDWTVPAALYRDWLASAWDIDEPARPSWLSSLRLALSWCPSDPAILDAIAKRISPDKVLLHLSQWRSDPYDQNHPTYAASAKGKAFIEKAAKMGFHAMPHCNSIDMDPTHPVYPYVRDFQYRELESGRVQGWTSADGQIQPVPESNAARLLHQDKNTMVKIHPGLAMWRSILTENVQSAIEDLDLDTVFLDVTLNTWNLQNCLVDNMTPTEGMKRLVAEVASLRGGIAVGGEGRNEITMQDQCFGQAHLFESWQESVKGIERTGGCAVNEFLFGKWCRSFGYSGLGGGNDAEALRMKLHVGLGAIPTLTVRSAVDIDNPNKAVKEILDLATA